MWISMCQKRPIAVSKESYYLSRQGGRCVPRRCRPRGQSEWSGTGASARWTWGRCTLSSWVGVGVGWYKWKVSFVLVCWQVRVKRDLLQGQKRPIAGSLSLIKWKVSFVQVCSTFKKRPIAVSKSPSLSQRCRLSRMLHRANWKYLYVMNNVMHTHTFYRSSLSLSLSYTPEHTEHFTEVLRHIRGVFHGQDLAVKEDIAAPPPPKKKSN
jgi:hypothetical protein